MAEVRLSRQQAETGDLPENCMRCGRQTEVWVPRQFSTRNAYQERRMLVLVPLCDRHRNQWRNRVRVNWTVVFALILIVATLIVSPSNLQVPLWITLGVVVVFWVGYNIVYDQLLLRAIEITDEFIELKRVSPGFVDVFREKKAADRRRREPTAIPQKLGQVQGKLIDVHLERWELEEGDLPKACMRCGAPSIVNRPRKFTWHPEWITTMIVFGFVCLMPLAIAGFILSIALTKRMRIPVPLCEKHRRRWAWRNAVGILGLVVLPVLGILGIIALSQSQTPQDAPSTLGGLFCGGTFFGLIIWLVTMAVLEGRAIRAAEITDRGITMRGISPAFLQALWEQRLAPNVESAEEEDDLTRRQPSPTSGEFFDPNAPRGPEPPRKETEENDA
jgi:rRNA maturation protein Nop10